MGPVVGRGPEVGTLRAVLRAGIAVGPHAGVGPVPVFHNLAHGCGHAAGEGHHAGACAVGAKGVVVRVLSPCGGEEGVDGGVEDSLGSGALEELSPMRVYGLKEIKEDI